MKINIALNSLAKRDVEISREIGKNASDEARNLIDILYC